MKSGSYSNKGLYSGYDKNHKERDALDYYSTPIEEVDNILDRLWLSLSGMTILEPCAGGGHMVKGIENYISKRHVDANIIASDVQKRPTIDIKTEIKAGLEYDFLSDDYPFVNDIDYVIMNPPFSLAEPFCMKAIDICKNGVIMFARLQFLEGQKRFESIFSFIQPTDIYVYVDRVTCYKNGDTSIAMNSVQAYAWFVFNKNTYGLKIAPKLHWIRRADKKE